MEKSNNKTKVYNVIIMDRSGSMWNIQQSAIQGYNEVLGGIKADAEKFAQTQEHFITLVLFDSTAIKNVYWNENPAKAEILTTKSYVPGAATPLYDAIGKTLTSLQKELANDTDYSVVVTIITDGLENSSTEHSLSDIQALIKHCKNEGWSFAYMGTEHDVESVSIGLSITNVFKFEKSKIWSAFCSERQARRRYNQKWEDFELAHPCASIEEKKNFKKRLSEEFYKED